MVFHEDSKTSLPAWLTMLHLVIFFLILLQIMPLTFLRSHGQCLLLLKSTIMTLYCNNTNLLTIQQIRFSLLPLILLSVLLVLFQVNYLLNGFWIQVSLIISLLYFHSFVTHKTIPPIFITLPNVVQVYTSVFIIVKLIDLLILHDVLYIPNFHVNLVSVQKLIQTLHCHLLFKFNFLCYFATNLVEDYGFI